MAQNFHKDLPNNQIHSPKDFSSALNRSVMTKDYQNVLKWNHANYTTSTTIKCYADSSGRTGGTWFKIYSAYDGNKYQIWFDVDNGSAAPDTISGYTRVEVDISSGDSANTIAAALKAVLDGLTSITATVSTDTVTVPDIKSATNPTDINTNFLFNSTQSVIGSEYLVTNSTGKIEWASQPKQYHQFEAMVAPKSASYYNKYHTTTSMGHSNKTLNTSLGVTTMPTSVLNKNMGVHSFLYLPSNVNSTKINYMAWHSNAGTQSVNFRIAECPVVSGGATGVLTQIAAITDSIDASKVAVKDVPCVTTTTGGSKVLIIYGAGPSSGAYYITANIELIVT